MLSKVMEWIPLVYFIPASVLVQLKIPILAEIFNSVIGHFGLLIGDTYRECHFILKI